MGLKLSHTTGDMNMDVSILKTNVEKGNIID